MLFALIIIQFFSFLFKQHAQIKENEIYESNITYKMFHGLINKPILYFRNNTIGSIIEKINIKNNVRDNIILKILPNILNFFSVFILLIYLSTVSIYLTILLIIMSLIYLIISLIMYVKRKNANTQYMQKNIAFSSLAQEDLNQIDQIKAQAHEDKVIGTWQNTSWDALKSYNSIIRLEGVSNAFNQVFNYISVILLIMLGIYLTKVGNVTIADVILFQSGMTIFITSVNQIQDISFEYSNINISADKLHDLFIPHEGKKAMIDINSKYAIALDNVSFGYEKNSKVFKNLNFQIAKGEKVAIVGGSGSGKTTLLNILLGLYSYSGNITYGHQKYRKQFGVVLQNMTLKKDTIFNNLIEEGNDVHTEQIGSVLKEVNIEDTVNSMPKKIFSNVFHNGKNLSGGQIQRLLLAKSLLNNKKIIFWDEAFSSIDN